MRQDLPEFHLKSHDRVCLAMLAGHAVLLVVLVFTRLVDFDEGFYLAAARGVSEGRLPYHDFFYPQAALLPYILSIFSGHAFNTLIYARLASAGLSVITAIVFYHTLRYAFADRRAVRAALFLYCFSGLVLVWHSVAKTFAVADVCLLLSFFLIVKNRNHDLWWRVFCSGLLLGIAINTRSVLAPIAIVLGLAVFAGTGKRKTGRLGLFILALAISSIPSLILLSIGPDRFWFDNIGFHLIRNPGTDMTGRLIQRLVVIGKLLVNPQALIIVALFAFSLWTGVRNRKSAGGAGKVLASPSALAGIAGLVIIFVYLLPSPIHQQYFFQAIPFALLASQSGLAGFLGPGRKRWATGKGRRLAIALTTVYILGVIPYGMVFQGGIRFFDGSNRIGNIREMCRYLGGSGTVTPVFSDWAAIPVLSGLQPVRGTEFAGFDFGLPLADEEKRYYHLPVSSDLRDILIADQPEFLVFIDQFNPVMENTIGERYFIERSFGRYVVYRLKNPPSTIAE